MPLSSRRGPQCAAEAPWAPAWRCTAPPGGGQTPCLPTCLRRGGLRQSRAWPPPRSRARQLAGRQVRAWPSRGCLAHLLSGEKLGGPAVTHTPQTCRRAQGDTGSSVQTPVSRKPQGEALASLPPPASLASSSEPPPPLLPSSARPVAAASSSPALAGWLAQASAGWTQNPGSQRLSAGRGGRGGRGGRAGADGSSWMQMVSCHFSASNHRWIRGEGSPCVRGPGAGLHLHLLVKPPPQ